MIKETIKETEKLSQECDSFFQYREKGWEKLFCIEEELKKLPGKPGVYIMHDAEDTIIYIGKAISLKNRVRQYFQSSRNLGIKKEQMVEQIARFEYIVTDSELEALVLECNLIKEHKPKYNTMLTDDKTYPFIKVTLQEEYPRIQIVRQMKKDKALWPVYQRSCSKRCGGACNKTIPSKNLQPKSAKGHQKRKTLSVLSDSSV